MKGRFYDLGELLYDKRRTKLEACQSHRERTSQLTRQRQISWKVLFLSRSSCLIKEICWLIWKVSRESMHDDFIWPYRKYWIVTPSFTSQSYIRSMIRIFTKLRSKGTNFFRISQFCNLSSADRPTIDWTAMSMKGNLHPFLIVILRQRKLQSHVYECYCVLIKVLQYLFTNTSCW